jgi:hypothetical protein
MASQPTVVLCGSITRAVAALDAAEAYYLAQGYTVHKPVKDDSVSREVHSARWRALIEQADLVVACTMQHQEVGEQTRWELEHAFDCVTSVRLWVEATPPGRVTCPWCQRDGRKLTQFGRIRHHLNAPGKGGWPTCEGTGKRPDEYYAERAS